MKKQIMGLIIGIIFLSLNAVPLIVLNSGSQTLSKIDLSTHQVINTFAPAGLYGNQLYYADEELWMVNSGDNNIQKVDKDNGQILKTYTIGNSTNPWNMIKDNQFIYVTAMMTGKIYRINTINDEIQSIDSGISPEGMLIVDNLLYVANTGFQYPNYQTGKIAIVDLNTFIKIDEISVPTNPQALIKSGDQQIHVMCTGNYANESGKIAVIDINSKEVINTLDIGGSPNMMTMDNNGKVYLGDGMGAGFFVYDSSSLEVLHSSQNPYLPGGSKIIFEGDEKFVLKTGNWVSYSHVEHRANDDSMIYDYSVGVGAIDLILLQTTTSTDQNITELEKDIINTYPNPVRKHVQIRSKKNDIQEISIFNIKGERIKTLKQGEYQWDTRNSEGKSCPNGIYFIVVRNNERESQVKKISIIR